MNIDKDSLTKLKCAKCGLHLSVGPVTATSTNSFICGRCDGEGARVAIYEVLAEKFAFPCCYQSYGCRETLKWGSVSQHERICTNRPYHCPVISQKACPWRGAISDIAGHFEISHTSDIADTNLIKLELSKREECRKLVKSRHGYYLFRTLFSKMQNLLMYSVVQLDSKSCTGSYQLKLHSEDFCKKVAHPACEIDPYELVQRNSFKARNRVDVGVLQFLVGDASSIFCKVVLDKEKKKDRAELLELVECPVCKEGMGAPIYQCTTGHSFCHPCTTRLDNCPLCHGGFTKARNYALEDLTSQISRQCRNKHLGCTYTGVFEDVKGHERTCVFYRCPLQAPQDCKWSGEFPSLIAHCKSSHQWLETETYGHVTNLTVDVYGTFRLVHSDGMFFRLCRQFKNREFCVVVQFVGPSEQAANYSYEFSFMAMANNKAKLVVQDICQCFSSDADAFNNSYKMPYSSLEPFVKNNKFKYDLKIIKK